MSIEAAVTRGYNFFVVAVLGIVGGALVGEVGGEALWAFRLDDLLVVAIGIAAVAWYLVGQHRYQRSFVPLALAGAAFAAKVLGLIVELKDTLEVSDDYMLVQVLLFLVIVAGVVYYRTRAVASTGAGTPTTSQIPTRVER